MSVPYRCMKCRGRNTLPRTIEEYKKTPKCRHCGHFRYYIDKARQHRTDICRDEGCCHYPHRYRSTLCRHHPEYELLMRVGRYGEDRQEVLLDMAFEAEVGKKLPEEAPF